MIGNSRRLPWMWTMRRFTICLLMLLAPLAALASDRLTDGDHDTCFSANSTARDTTPAAEATSARNSARKATPSSSDSGGGSDGDSLFLRMRTMPRWHSFLPGMFR